MCVEVILCNISVDFLKMYQFYYLLFVFIPVRSRLMPINSPTAQLVDETVPSFNATQSFRDDFFYNKSTLLYFAFSFTLLHRILF